MDKMMNSKCLLWLGVILVCFAGVAMAETFIWTGDGDPNFIWSECLNWEPLAPDPDPCYPSEITDDVLIFGDDETVILEEELPNFVEIQDIAFKGIFTIDSNTISVTKLEADSMRVIGGTNGATLTLTGNAFLNGRGS